jgi:hypothetical protein
MQPARHSKQLIIAACSMLLTSCITSKIDNWPQSIPAKQHFAQAYSLDQQNQRLQAQTEYLEWIVSFYEGSLAYQSGWLDLESALLDGAESQRLAQLDSRLEAMGATIGSEWAKHNDVRLIDSRMLSLWVSVLQLSRGVGQQRQTIELISSDVDGLLSGKLAKEDIVESRYAERLQLDLFEDF